MNTPNPQTTCNPINLSYRFQLEGISDTCCREAADPSVVPFQGKLWLFASKSGGYWWSDDVKKWHFIPTSTLPTEDYAPDVRVINDWLYCTASAHEYACPIYRTQNPLADEWELVSKPFPFWDPNMFQDEDGKVYLYWGCSDQDPLYACEMNPETMQSVGETVSLFGGDADAHGWERKSKDNRPTDNPPFIEGPWMTKHGGRYYLQYAGPGTEFNIYADGVYESHSPLGPFSYAENNPYSYKPGGFINGAGHGSTFEDKYANLWHISTMSISVNHMFERRLGIWPAGFDKDGVLFCNTRFGDYPHKHPDGPWKDPWQDTDTGWMLLNYGTTVQASSEDPEHGAKFISDEDSRTYWAAAQGDEAPVLIMDLEQECSIHAIQVNFAEFHCQTHGRPSGPVRHRYCIMGSNNESDWEMVVDKQDASEDTPHDYVELSSPLVYRYIKISIAEVPAQGRVALSGVRLFGVCEGPVPTQPQMISAQYHKDDELTACIHWRQVEGATGYNLRWGFAPDKLYHDWLVYGHNTLDLPALNRGQRTYVAVEAFNRSGVSKCSDIIEIGG